MSVVTVPQSSGSSTLFDYAVTRNGRTIVKLSGIPGDGAQVRVEAEVSPLHDRGRSDAVRWSHVFSSLEQAKRFADETLIAFEYLNCDVAEVSFMHA